LAYVQALHSSRELVDLPLPPPFIGSGVGGSVAAGAELMLEAEIPGEALDDVIEAFRAPKLGRFVEAEE
jgi:hypothetical protein